ncbi:hormone-sensitive lipase isoform X2 [Oncorhynchus mykiss]|uniref:hormone-sensitive lipase isoform X2 n=1 Tax=Oncorhynchus mykiss TaxID=8022 RepID=UPI0018782F7C|nr:hormone-sensitive lipase isoform X2 [Oncorhynchus mykiss]
MASGKKGGNSSLEKVMDTKAVFTALYSVCEENATFFSEGAKGSQGGAAQRLVDTMTLIQEHARSLEPVISGFAAVYHHFDFDPHIPANGYRSLVKVVRCCILHIIHKGRYISTNRRSIFFRTAHNAGEMEAYCSALCQLRALLYLAQRLLHDNSHGNLFFHEESGLSQSFIREYSSMHKGCFYGRCLGFQFTPAIRPCLQTIAIGLVAFGENYRRHQSGIGVAASSFFTSGKYAIDPELRGAEFERITQNLDVHFWKAFWNITETEVLSSLASMTSTQVKVNRALSVPPVPFDLPLVADPHLTVTIEAPSAHTGPGPVQMRLISFELREGQDSEALLSLSRSEGGPISLSLGMKTKQSPPSRWLLVHYHGGGFVAQTSKSHEPYLKSWSQDLGVPILSVDYSLAPEAPFPRALEDCFYAYCWAIKNHQLLGWTGENVCLAGDSAGGNLCITTSMRAASHGVRMPDGIVAAYPAILLTAYASPSRLLTLFDPLLPLSVLSRCLSAYAGEEPQAEKQVEKVSTLSMVRRDTALLLRDFKQGASNWIHSLLDPNRAAATASTDTSSSVRKSVSEASISSPHSDPPVPPEHPFDFSLRRESLKSHTCQDLAGHANNANSTPAAAPTTPAHNAMVFPEPTPDNVSFFLSKEEAVSMSDALSSVAIAPPEGEEGVVLEHPREFPLGFEPLRSERLAEMKLATSPVVRNPYMSPLLAPDSMLRGLPPIHLVACALDPMLDDSVMFAKRLRNVDQPVTLCVVDDLPHGFLSLSQLSRETREAANVCVNRIRDVFDQKDSPQEPRMHRKLERTNQRASSVATGDPEKLFAAPIQEEELLVARGGALVQDGEELVGVAAQNNIDIVG